MQSKCSFHIFFLSFFLVEKFIIILYYIYKKKAESISNVNKIFNMSYLFILLLLKSHNLLFITEKMVIEFSSNILHF